MNTQLFVYGSLRHDQPEHRRFCRGVTGWRPARVRGRLWTLPSGYLLLVVAPEDLLLRATADADGDERRRSRIVVAPVASPEPPSGGEPEWVSGEVLEFSDASEVWPSVDGWEEFTPGAGGAYQRCIIPVWVEDEKEGWTAIAAWAYVADHPPEGAFEGVIGSRP